MSNEGWICPVCRRGKAPHVETCDCVEAPHEHRELTPLDYPDATKTAPTPFEGWPLPWHPTLPPYTWPITPQPPKVTWSTTSTPVFGGGHHIQ